MWKIRAYLIKLLAGRQTVVLNTRITFAHKGFDEEDIFLNVRGHHKKYIMKNIEINNISGERVNYDELRWLKLSKDKTVYVDEASYNRIVKELGYKPSNLVSSGHIPKNQAIMFDDKEFLKRMI